MTLQHDIVIRNGSILDGSGGPAFTGDVAISGDRIVAVGIVDAGGREEIDASGMLVTPGFVDVHTHYDGQATWEHRMMPSSNHGVTTVITGNCGIGFAPCRPEDRRGLIRLMEGVEDVPEVVMDAGLPWNWETFPDYLDALDARDFDVDIGTQLPHAPLRVYVMGDRAVVGEAATADECVQMSALVEEAMRAGALGFATSRNLFHRDSTGAIICTREAEETELVSIAGAMRRAGTGVIEAVLDLSVERLEEEFPLLRRMSEVSGRPLSFSLVDMAQSPQTWRRGLDLIDEANRDGFPITAQVIGRPTGFLFGLTLSYNPFSFHPSYMQIAHLPLEDRVARMREPDFRARLLKEAPDEAIYPTLQLFLRYYDWTFKLGDPPDYEPAPETSISAQAQCHGVSADEIALDMLLEDEGRSILFVTAANYAGGTLDNTLEMIRNEHTLLGLGDGGAHYGLICDAGTPTFMLTYWTRDRQRGDRLPIEGVVHRLTSKNAAAVGLHDRGLVAQGYKADLNIIDYDRLHLCAPQMRRDLPGGGARLSQEARGYVATLLSGKITYRDGVPTGLLPGRLIRGAQPQPAG